MAVLETKEEIERGVNRLATLASEINTADRSGANDLLTEQKQTVDHLRALIKRADNQLAAQEESGRLLSRASGALVPAINSLYASLRKTLSIEPKGGEDLVLSKRRANSAYLEVILSLTAMVVLLLLCAGSLASAGGRSYDVVVVGAIVLLGGYYAANYLLTPS